MSSTILPKNVFLLETPLLVKNATQYRIGVGVPLGAVLRNDMLTRNICGDRRAPALAGRMRRKRLAPEKTLLRGSRPAKAGALRSSPVAADISLQIFRVSIRLGKAAWRKPSTLLETRNAEAAKTLRDAGS